MDKNYVSSGEVKVGLVCVTDIRRLNLNTLTKKKCSGDSGRRRALPGPVVLTGPGGGAPHALGNPERHWTRSQNGSQGCMRVGTGFSIMEADRFGSGTCSAEPCRSRIPENPSSRPPFGARDLCRKL